MWVFLNNQFVPREEARISVFDHGFLYGDGVYETLRSYHGHVFMRQKHIARLFRSARMIGLTIPIPAVFPGGTITGVPKVRCMEIVDELEPVRRGPYTGSLGYLSWSGDMDLNILIRTLVLANDCGFLQVGAGIVADSDPQREYEETLLKAEAIFQTLNTNLEI